MFCQSLTSAHLYASQDCKINLEFVYLTTVLKVSDVLSNITRAHFHSIATSQRLTLPTGSITVGTTCETTWLMFTSSQLWDHREGFAYVWIDYGHKKKGLDRKLCQILWAKNGRLREKLENRPIVLFIIYSKLLKYLPSEQFVLSFKTCICEVMHVSFYSAKHKHSMYQMWLSRQCFCFLFFFFLCQDWGCDSL